MGLFGSTIKNVVASSTQPLILGSRDTLSESVSNAVLSNLDIIDNIRYGILTGNGLKFDKMYRYGEDHYTLGLPEGRTTSVSINLDNIKSTLDGIYNDDVEILSVTLDYGDATTLEESFLTNIRNIDFTTNEVHNPPINASLILANNKTYIIESISTEANTYIDNHSTTSTTTEIIDEIEYTTVTTTTGTYSYEILNTSDVETFYIGSNGSIENWVGTYSNTLNYVVKIYYVLEHTTTINGTLSGITISNPIEVKNFEYVTTSTENQNFYNTSSDFYYTVRYINSQGITDTFIYNTSDGTYPSLSISIGSPLAGSFFPIIPIRKDNEDYTAEDRQSTELYETSKKLLDIINIDIHEVADNVNENPDIDDIDHAYIYFGTHIQSTETMPIRYMVDFFEHLQGNDLHTENDYLSSGYPLVDGEYDTTGTRTYQPAYNIHTISDEDLTIDIGYLYSTTEYIQGSIGKKGIAESETIEVPDGSYWKAPTSVKSDADYTVQSYDRDKIVFRYQVTSDTYKEVTVVGLYHENHIYKDKSVITRLSDSLDEDNYNFIVPLHYDVFNSYQISEKNNLAVDAMHIVFNTHERLKLKWYETTLFSFIITVVGIYFAAPQIAAGIQSLGTALVAGISSLIKLVAISLLKSTIINKALEFVFDKLGLENALSILVLAVTVGTLSNVASVDGLPWADELLKVSTVGFNVLQTNIQESLANIADEFKTFQEQVEADSEYLAEFNELLDTSTFIDPFNFIDIEPYFNPDESTTDYYNRTIGTQSISAMVLESITNYVDLKLQLPETLDTVKSAEV